MDSIDYDAEATMFVMSHGRDPTSHRYVPRETESHSGPLADIINHAFQLGTQGQPVEVEWNGIRLGFGLIEAIFQRPDFPRPDLENRTGWEGGEHRSLSARRQPDSESVLASRLLSKISQVTGIQIGGGRPERPVVWLVEDEPLVRMLGVDLLTEAGFEVLQASDADEALTLLEARPDIEVLFTDVNMPGSLDGLKLASWASESRPHLK